MILDPCLSYRVASGVIAALPNRNGYTISLVGDNNRNDESDWLRKFTAAHDIAIVSGDHKSCSTDQIWWDLIIYYLLRWIVRQT